MYPLISIVVPVYNVENVFSFCIESLLNQTYPNIEIVLVDDGSSDSSGSICDEYANTYLNVRAFHKTNGGQSSARNLGIEKARGEYIGFIDSDDYVDTEMYEYLYKLIKKYDADVSSIGCKLVHQYNVIYSQENEMIKEFIGDEVLNYYMERAARLGDNSICKCLFKKTLVKNCKQREGHFYEDIDYKYLVLKKARKFVESNKICYYYVQSQDSTSLAPFKPKDYDLVLAGNTIYEICLKDGNSKNIYYAKIIQNRAYFSLLARIAYLGFADGYYNKDEQKSIVREFTKKNRENYLFLIKASIPLSRKLALTLLCINFQLLHIPMTIVKIMQSKKLVKKQFN